MALMMNIGNIDGWKGLMMVGLLCVIRLLRFV